MIGYIVIGAAAALDGFAAGVFVGRKWGAKLTKAAIQADGAAVEAKVEQVEAQVAPVVAKVEAVAQGTAKTAEQIAADIQVHLAAAKANAPK